MTSQNSYMAVIAVTLLSVGCTTPAPTIQPDTPPQKGAALIGWAFSVPGAPHNGVHRDDKSQSCETGREKFLTDTPYAKPTPCLPVKVTAD